MAHGLAVIFAMTFANRSAWKAKCHGLQKAISNARVTRCTGLSASLDSMHEAVHISLVGVSCGCQRLEGNILPKQTLTSSYKINVDSGIQVAFEVCFSARVGQGLGQKY